MSFRVGQGWDRHALVQGRACILGGVLFPDCPVGPQGHSDGDAVVHALIDALLGASGLGDIGRHFPDTDARYAGADSLTLLLDAWKMVQDKGFELGNADFTVITERPRISVEADNMAQKMATAMGVDASQLSIKATRGEGMGPEGRGECVTAMVTVLLKAGA